MGLPEDNGFLKAPIRVLIVEDEEAPRQLYATALRRAGYQVEVAPTIQKARSLLIREHFDIFLCDIEMEDGRGTDLLRGHAITLAKRGTKIIVLSAENNYRALYEAWGANFCLQKPLSLSYLLRLIERLTTSPA